MTSALGSAVMPSAYFDLLARDLGGPQGDMLRRGTGRPLGDVSPQIEVSQQLVQIDNVNATHAPGWGLRMGSLFDAPAHGPVGFAMLSAPDLNAALEVARRYGHVRTPFLVLQLRRNAHETTLVTHSQGLDSRRRVPVLESTAVSLHKIAVAVTGSRSAIATTFDYPAPAWAGSYRAYLGDVVFGASENTLTVAAEVASARSPLADAGVHAAALRALEHLALPAQAPHARTLAQLEHLLDVDQGRTTLKDASVRLHQSTRTLERSLRAAGTTFRDLVDGYRRERAEALLADPAVPLAHVGGRVGYDDAANFGRACRRWFGTSPGECRRTSLSRAGTPSHEAQASTSDTDQT